MEKITVVLEVGGSKITMSKDKGKTTLKLCDRSGGIVMIEKENCGKMPDKGQKK